MSSTIPVLVFSIAALVICLLVVIHMYRRKRLLRINRDIEKQKISTTFSSASSETIHSLSGAGLRHQDQDTRPPPAYRYSSIEGFGALPPAVIATRGDDNLERLRVELESLRREREMSQRRVQMQYEQQSRESLAIGYVEGRARGLGETMGA